MEILQRKHCLTYYFNVLFLQMALLAQSYPVIINFTFFLSPVAGKHNYNEPEDMNLKTSSIVTNGTSPHEHDT